MSCGILDASLVLPTSPDPTLSYVAEISRSSPTAILMVIDQSTSMLENLSSGQVKARFLADVLNKTLYTIVTNCSKADGIRDYFHIGVVAYSGNNARNGFNGELGDTPLHAISHLANHPLRVESRMRKVVGPDEQIIEQPVKFPVWFDPRSRGMTSMCAGLSMALKVLSRWCSDHPTAYPPTVLHITDGHPTDGDPEPIARKIRALKTKDGPCLLFNLHVDRGQGDPLLFPTDEGGVGDGFGKMLFRMSSVLPPHAVGAARSKGHEVGAGARGFVFNAGIESIADFFDIGTRAAR